MARSRRHRTPHLLGLPGRQAGRLPGAKAAAEWLHAPLHLPPGTPALFHCGRPSASPRHRPCRQIGAFMPDYSINEKGLTQTWMGLYLGGAALGALLTISLTPWVVKNVTYAVPAPCCLRATPLLANSASPTPDLRLLHAQRRLQPGRVGLCGLHLRRLHLVHDRRSSSRTRPTPCPRAAPGQLTASHALAPPMLARVALL